MPNLLQTVRGSRSITSIDDYANALNHFMFNGNTYGLGTGLNQTLQGGSERIANDLQGFASSAYAANGVVFACMAVRQLVFSAIRFQWQQMNGGRPSKMFGTSELALLEKPWAGGTTQDMTARMIQDADLAGNSYWFRDQNELVRMRPDWVEIVLEPRHTANGRVGYRKLGYLYHENGIGGSANASAAFLPDEVVHFAPIPDPLATYRGMSWLTPVLREIANDKAMGKHKAKFFENGGTPNMIYKLDKSISPEKVRIFAEQAKAQHSGVDIAYEALFLGGGADATVVGANFQQMDFKQVQGHGETRIAAAAGVPPVIVGLSEGLEAATYSNYAQARRRFADGTMHPLGQNAAGSVATVIAQPTGGVRLWYDARDVPFLREDRKDAAEIQQAQAVTIQTLIQSGYEPASVAAAVEAEDWGLLVHTGLVSVQLQPPGSKPTGVQGGQE